jgi:hypothetical protein
MFLGLWSRRTGLHRPADLVFDPTPTRTALPNALSVRDWLVGRRQRA